MLNRLTADRKIKVNKKIMQTWIIWKENNPLLLKSNRYPRKSQKIPESRSLVTN